MVEEPGRMKRTDFLKLATPKLEELTKIKRRIELLNPEIVVTKDPGRVRGTEFYKLATPKLEKFTEIKRRIK